MSLIEELTLHERKEVLQRLQVPPKAGREILDGIERAQTALLRLQGASQKDIYNVLFPLNIQTILFTMAKAQFKEQKKAVSLYLTTLRKIRPELRGEDLQEMGYTPGPMFKKIFHAILDARLERRVKSREDEIQLVKERFTK
jgi:tRNA nucleotidyltransferase (CCA-adding enzyme)